MNGYEQANGLASGTGGVGGGWNANNSLTKPMQAAIPCALDHLDERIKGLYGAAENLEARLTPVLAVEPGQAIGKERAPTQNSVAGRIQGSAIAISDIIERLGRLVGRLEL